jgi:hypothetical protein
MDLKRTMGLPPLKMKQRLLRGPARRRDLTSRLAVGWQTRLILPAHGDVEPFRIIGARVDTADVPRRIRESVDAQRKLSVALTTQE